MNTSEVLNRAADHIERYGHHKGRGYAEVGNIRSASCTHGALCAVEVLKGGDRRPAQAAIRAHIGSFSIGDWNDAPERTAEQVIATLRACAVIEAAKEDAETRQPVTA